MPLPNARPTSLVAWQSRAVGPIPVAIALRILSAAAAGLDAVHKHALSLGKVPCVGFGVSDIVIASDGAVSLALDSPLRERTARFRSPEEVQQSGVDARSDVFSLGVLFWELCAGSKLFERDSVDATSLAIVEALIPFLHAVSGSVPAVVGEVLSVALERDPNSRFDTVLAFRNALVGACASVGIREATPEDMARFQAERVPRGASTQMAAVVPIAIANNAVPELDIPAPPPSRRRESSAAVPASQRAPVTVTSGPASVKAPPASAGRPTAVAFEPMPDDDDDMEIERNMVPSAMAHMPSSSGHGGPPSVRQRERLELAAGPPSRATPRAAASAPPSRRGVGAGTRVLGALGALLTFGGTAFAAFKLAHRHGGRPILTLFPHAFDGSSAPESGVFAVVTLLVSITLLFIGLRLRPHAWSIVSAAGVALLLSLAMVTATLASSAENPTPADGVLVVPYLTPATLFLLAFGLVARGARILARRSGAQRFGGVPLAILAALLAFAAFEISALATLVPWR